MPQMWSRDDARTKSAGLKGLDPSPPPLEEREQPATDVIRGEGLIKTVGTWLPIPPSASEWRRVLASCIPPHLSACPPRPAGSWGKTRKPGHILRPMQGKKPGPESLFHTHGPYPRLDQVLFSHRGHGPYPDHSRDRNQTLCRRPGRNPHRRGCRILALLRS